ncbi:hypothetical protein BH10PSE17_BH10PSE17_01410 [soil metagenome]
MPLVHVAYVSSVKSPFDRARFGGFVQTACRLHARLGLTGVSAYSPFSCFHVMEGIAPDVDMAFEQIVQDQRHSNVSRVLRERIRTRRFPTWTLGLTVVPVTFGFEQRIADERAIVELGWGHVSRLLIALERGALAPSIHAVDLAEWVGPLAAAALGYDEGLLASELR